MPYVPSGYFPPPYFGGFFGPTPVLAPTPANIFARYVAVLKAWAVRIENANTGLDGSGTLGVDIYELASGGAAGSRIGNVHVHATASTVAGLVRFFLKMGSDVRLVKEIEVTAVTPSATTPAFSADWTPDLPTALSDSWAILVTTDVAQQLDITAVSGLGDY